ncbi:MAG: penicillin-binding protein 2 [Candidatus Buchananbacteria bacterium]|nr:penicillin-binding protein 2 [Candidatus Buchananbacteria bacterium]
MKSLFIKRKYKKSQEIEEDFFYNDEFNTETADSYKNNDEFLGKHLSEKKINIFLILIFLGLSLLFVRTFQLQVVKGEHYVQLAEINRTVEKPVLAARGLIYDKNKQPLVKNVPIFDALILPKDLSLNTGKRAEQIELICQVINQDKNKIAELLNEYPRNFKYFLTIRENIDYQDALLLKIKAQQIPGLYIETRNQREYNNAIDFSHILGYLGKITKIELEKYNSDYLLNDYIGKTGLELAYEDVLRGEYGKKRVEVDVMGQEKKVLYYEEPQSGENLILSIDKNVQQKVREILNSYLTRLNKKRASLVMLNPQNGEILALVSLPDFDNNLFAKGISSQDYKQLIENEDQPLFNRTIKGEYPSGSTIKPVVAAGALDQGIITDRTSFMSSGGLWLYDRWFFPDWATGGHGLTNVYKAIAWSVNTYFYIIGGGYEDFQGLGVEGLKKYYNLFGLGQETGIDLIGEEHGLVPDPDWKIKVKDEEWYIGDTYHIAIGQGDLLVTPLQVANFTSVFANGGTLYQPHLVKEVFSNQNESRKISPKILRDGFINQDNLNIIKQAMRQTVTNGSAQYLNNLNFSVSGKTGTAQWRKDKNNHAWFTGFAPYDNPEVVITVLVEEGGEGSQVSVPIAYEVLNWYFNDYLQND